MSNNTVSAFVEMMSKEFETDVYELPSDLERLFENPTHVKIIMLFLSQPLVPFSVEDIQVKFNLSKHEARNILDMLLCFKIISQDGEKYLFNTSSGASYALMDLKNALVLY